MQRIEKAAKLAVSTLSKIIPFLKPGISEKEIAQEIKKHLKPSFRVIVASGKRSANPHAFASKKKLKKGDLVVIDFGAKVGGQCSDITRTFVIGKPTKRQRKIIRIVKRAQKAAIAKVRAGIEVKEVDSAARRVIKRAGHGKYFIHNTGHGIGRKVHQSPKISKKNRRRLRKGMVITIEPGIYIKGWGGVRIEDMVRVTKKGCIILTR